MDIAPPRRFNVRSPYDGSTLDFAAFSADWRAGLPKLLDRESPAKLLRLLAIVELGEEIYQADLQRRLDMNQSRLSKLLTKLINAGLLKERNDRGGDRRLQLLKTTASGRRYLRFLEPDLSEAALRVLAEGSLEVLP